MWNDGNMYHSVQSSHSVMSNSLRPHDLQHARPPCPSPTPRVHPNPGPSSWWCHPTISSSVVTFSSCPQSFPASGSFQMSQLFSSGGQSIRVSASASVLPMNTWLFKHLPASRREVPQTEHTPGLCLGEHKLMGDKRHQIRWDATGPQMWQTLRSEGEDSVLKSYH